MRSPAIDFDTALNPEQLAAVTHEDGPQLVLAGAGSGKTRVITYRIAWLARERGVDPSTITAVTFTNKAAGEMRERVEELLGLFPLPAFVSTFHRFALRLLRIYGERVGLERGFAILDAADQLAIVKKAMAAENVSTQNFSPQAILAQISSAKNRLLGPSAYERQADDFLSRSVAPIYRRYQKMLREEAGGVDFDDMIRLAVQLLAGDETLRERLRRRHRHLLVDEFQDTNHAQLRLVRELSDGRRLTAVGDEDQSIYRWRGADLNNILDFETHFPGTTVRKLERNYRSTQTILDASGAVVEHNARRRGKRLWTEAGDGEPLKLYRAKDEGDEARWVVATLARLEGALPLSEMAILVRTNAQTRALEDELLRRRLAYALIGSVRFYERAEIKDLVAYLRLLRRPDDLFSLTRVVNRPPRGIGKTTREALLRRAEERDKSAWAVLLDDDLAGFPIRGAKALLAFRDLMQELGREAEVLALPALLDRVLEATSYLDLYPEDEAEGRSRRENIGELRNAVQEFTEAHAWGSDEDDLLAAFLDHAALTSSADTAAGERLSLMTLHSAKGLEFEVMVLPGLEEDLLPHFNASGHDEDLEEERRLFYVGLTRAKCRVFLASCRRRRRAGLYQDQKESRFVREIPAELLDVEESPQLRDRHASTGNVMSFFQRESPPAPEDESQELPEPPAAASGRPRSRFAPRPLSELGLRRGRRVRHPHLGEGKVLSIDGEGEDARLVVAFEGVGRRKLIAKYAQLEIL